MPSFARSGASFPIVPGDYGLIQYGQFGIFFQYSQAAQPLGNYGSPELLVALSSRCAFSERGPPTSESSASCVR